MQPTHQTVYVRHEPVNAMALTGFIISLVGFLTCGLLSPIGLLFSFIGLFSNPKGFAIAGVALGVIGSWWLWAFGFVMITAMTGIAAIGSGAAAGAASQARQPRPRPTATRTIDPPQREMPEPAELFPTVEPEPDKYAPLPLDIEATKSPAEMLEPEPSLNPPEPEKRPTPQFREFRSAAGNFTVSARYIGMEDKGKTVMLRREDTGKMIWVPLENLSEADQEWIAEKRKSK